MSVELSISSSDFLKSSRVHPCQSGCIHEDTLFPIPPGFNYSADGALVDAWPYFPGLKVGHNLPLFFLLDYSVPLVINRYIFRSTIIP
jgi:hypothetical protein